MGFNPDDVLKDHRAEMIEPKDWMEDRTFKMITGPNELKKIVDKAISRGMCAVDLETEGLDNRIDSSGKTQDKIVGYCLSFHRDLGVYVPVRHKRTDGEMQSANLDPRETAQEIARLCENCTTIWHNAQFDHEFLYGSSASINIESASAFEDTMILSYLKDPTSKQHGLKHLSEELLDQEMFGFNEVLAGSFDSFGEIDIEDHDNLILWYAGSDAICTYQLYHELKEYGEQQKTVYRLEKACVASNRWLERCRPKVDYEYVRRTYNELWEMITETKVEFYKMASDLINQDWETVRSEYDIKSPQQLGELLEEIIDVNDYDIELERTEKSGQVKTDDDTIEYLSEEYGSTFPFLEKIADYRNLTKVESTYIRPLLYNTDIHADFIPWHKDPEAKIEGGEPEREEVQGRIGDSTTRLKFNPYGTDSGRFSAKGGNPEAGASGINVQSAPGTYNAATFSAKRIHDRPEGPGDDDPELFDRWVDAVENQNFLKKVYDNHFIRDNRENQEYCLRKTCKGCPFVDECDHDEPEDKRLLSIESAFRPSFTAREGSIMLAIDFSGMEMRVAAELSDEENWKEEFIHGEGDGHKQTAKIIYGDDVVDLPKNQFKMKRQKAKCVTGDTLVKTDRGLLPIEDLDPGAGEDEFVEFDTPVKVWTEEGKREATHFYNGGERETVRITTDGRFQLEADKTHRVRIYDRENGYMWKEAGQLSEEDYVVIDKTGFEHGFDDQIIPLRDREVRISKIKRVEEAGVQQVYDLTVPDTGSFWSNGFTSHNSANFAVLYGGGGGAIARNTGISDDEGWEILNKMKDGLPSYTKWESEVIERAHNQGYVETAIGRRVPLKDINSSEDWLRSKMERKATNTIIQGSATGDLIKYAMVAVRKSAKKRDLMDDIRLWISLHDELVFEVKKETLEQTVPLIREKMTEFGDKMGWDVPIEVDVEVGEVWDTPYVWDDFKETEERTGLTPKPVPSFLKNHLDYHRGMWKRENKKRLLYDGEEFIPSDSPAYDWGACHEWNEENKLCRSYVPEGWWDYIHWKTGMWRKKDDGEEFFVEDQWVSDYDTYLEQYRQTHEKEEGEDVEEESEEKEEETFESAYREYVFKIRTNLNGENWKLHMTRLEHVLSFMKTYIKSGKAEPTHRLRVKSPRGEDILTPEDTPLINRELFEALVDYEGL